MLRIGGIVEFGAPVVGSANDIAAIAEGQKSRHGDAVTDYLAGHEKGYGVPIKSFREIEPIRIEDIEEVYPKFSPPQLYMRLENNPSLLSYILRRIS